jgi:hypothetical protein
MDKPNGKAPSGLYPGEYIGSLTLLKQRDVRYKATGEFRAPRKGEYYLSGAVIQAYRAPNDFSDDMRYWIAVPGRITAVTTVTWEPLT